MKREMKPKMDLLEVIYRLKYTKKKQTKNTLYHSFRLVKVDFLTFMYLQVLQSPKLPCSLWQKL